MRRKTTEQARIILDATYKRERPLALFVELPIGMEQVGRSVAAVARGRIAHRATLIHRIVLCRTIIHRRTFRGLRVFRAFVAALVHAVARHRTVFLNRAVRTRCRRTGRRGLGQGCAGGEQTAHGERSDSLFRGAHVCILGDQHPNGQNNTWTTAYCPPFSSRRTRAALELCGPSRMNHP